MALWLRSRCVCTWLKCQRRESSSKYPSAHSLLSMEKKPEKTKRYAPPNEPSVYRKDAASLPSGKVKKHATPSEPLVLSTTQVSSFCEVHIKPQLVSKLEVLFPHARKPTEPQKHLLLALHHNYNIILRSKAGTGKSFALLLYLLSTERVTHKDPVTSVSFLSTSCLLLVPSGELALQYKSWADTLLGNLSGKERVFQTFFRGSQEEEAEQDHIHSLHPRPHLIIGTPTRLLDLVSKNVLLDFRDLRKLAVDEADLLVEPLKKFPLEKEIQKRNIHIPPAELLINYVLKQQGMWAKYARLPNVHFVAISATANKRLEALFYQKKWVRGVSTIGMDPEGGKWAWNLRIPTNIQHSVLLASTSMDATLPQSSPYNKTMKENLQRKELLDQAWREGRDIEPKPQFDRRWTDVIIKILHNENAKSTIVFLNHKLSPKNLAEELQARGVETNLDIRTYKGKVTIAQSKFVRGLDLDLSLAICLGLPESAIEYIHMAGRVGRFSRLGKVVTIISENDIKEMAELLLKIGCRPSKYWQNDESSVSTLKHYKMENEGMASLGM